LLFRAGGGLDETPSVVEFCLETNVFAFFLVLGAKNLELFWFERVLYIGGVWIC
jgi:hypothetical protein